MRNSTTRPVSTFFASVAHPKTVRAGTVPVMSQKRKSCVSHAQPRRGGRVARPRELVEHPREQGRGRVAPRDDIVERRVGHVRVARVGIRVKKKREQVATVAELGVGARLVERGQNAADSILLTAVEIHLDYP